jgi:hypothetical protein
MTYRKPEKVENENYSIESKENAGILCVNYLTAEYVTMLMYWI